MCRNLIYFICFGLVLCVSAGVTNADIIAYWPFDEGSGDVAADVVGGFDAQLTNVDWVAGQFDGSALETDRSGDEILAGPGPTPTTQDLSVAWWMVDNYDSYETVMNKCEGDSTAGYSMLLRPVAEVSPLLFRIGGFQAYGGWGVECALPTGAYSKGEWTHIVCTYDSASDTATIYCNGELAPNGDNNPKTGIAGPTGYCEGVNDATQPLYIVGQREGYGGIVDEVAIWDHAMTPEEVFAVYTLGPLMLDPGLAGKPNPEDEATDILREAVLGWKPGEGATAHDVYLGTVLDDVTEADRLDPRGVLVSQGQSSPIYDPPGRLDLGQTYYWRIDEVIAPGDAPIKGDTWSFATEPVAYAVAAESITTTASSAGVDQGPENTVNGSGLADGLHSDEFTAMWITALGETGPAWIQYEFDKVLKLDEMLVWNYNDLLESVVGLGCKDVTIEYSGDGTDFMTLGTTHEFARAPGETGYAANTAVDFRGVAAKYVKLTINSNWGGILEQFGLSEVQFLSIPVFAREPSPNSGASDVGVDVTLNWRAGREADTHDVYLSTDEQAVIDGTAPAATVAEPSYASSLDLASTYYWRVDEVNDTPVAPVAAYDQNFDSLAVGTNLQSVEGWEGWYGDESVAGLVTDEQAYSGNRSLRFTRPVDACPYWNKITSGSWTLTTMQYVPSTASSGDAYYGVLHSYEQSTSGSAGWITEVISDFAAGDVRISGGDTARVPLVRDAWAEIRTELNFDSQVASFYYNGALLGTRDAVGLAGFDLWANSDDVMYFDDFLLVSAATPGGTTWQGEIWNLSTQEYFVVDDFESYNDLDPGDPESNRIFLTWIGGDDDPANGAQVGHNTLPFTEQTTVYDGKQSAPLYYDNSTAGYSEATANVANLQVGQDWTKHGIKALTLRFLGDPTNAAQQMYVKINGSKVPYDGDAENLKVLSWQMWYIDLSSLNVSNVTTLSIGLERIGAVGGQGVVYLDGIRLYSRDRQLVTPVEPDAAGLVGHWKLDDGSGLTAADSSGSGNNGTLMNMTGTEWTAGILDGALKFDSVTQYVDCGSNPSLELTGAVTISAWAKMEPANEGVYQGIAGKKAGDYGYTLIRHSTNVFRMWVLTKGQYVGVTSDVTYNDTEWHHVAGVVSNGTGYLYVDGFEQAHPLPVELADSSDYAFIGRTYSDFDGRYWNGTIDDVRIYDRALMPEEAAGLAGRTEPFDK